MKQLAIVLVFLSLVMLTSACGSKTLPNIDPNPTPTTDVNVVITAATAVMKYTGGCSGTGCSVYYEWTISTRNTGRRGDYRIRIDWITKDQPVQTITEYDGTYSAEVNSSTEGNGRSPKTPSSFTSPMVKVIFIAESYLGGRFTETSRKEIVFQ